MGTRGARQSVFLCSLRDISDNGAARRLRVQPLRISLSERSDSFRFEATQVLQAQMIHSSMLFERSSRRVLQLKCHVDRGKSENPRQRFSDPEPLCFVPSSQQGCSIWSVNVHPVTPVLIRLETNQWNRLIFYYAPICDTYVIA